MAIIAANFSNYVAQDYVEADYLDQSEIAATFSLQGTLSPAVIISDVAYPPYTWDSTGSTSWDDWPDNIWGGEGWTAQARTQLTGAPGLIFAASAILSIETQLQGIGNHIFAGQAGLSAIAEVTGIGNHIFAGNSAITATTNLQIQGNYILFGDSIQAVVASISNIFAGVARFGTANPSATIAFSLDQSGQNGTAGLLFSAASAPEANTTFSIDQSGLNGTAGIRFNAQPETLQGFFSTLNVAVFIPRDPYRFLLVGEETRHIPVIQETRLFVVPAETRQLIEGIAEYDTFRRRHV